jgi:diguanylate cyclase
MSRYPHNRDQSAEIFRLVLQRMSQHAAGFTPFAYTIWYEYLAGGNPGLVVAVDEWLAQGKAMDATAVEHLFGKHVADLDIDVARKLQSGAFRILEEISRHTAEVDSSAQEFGSRLEKNVSRLSEKPGEDVLGEVMAALQADTGKMQEAVHTLAANLQASRKGVEELKGALDNAQREMISDPMTGVFNRRGFEIKLGEMLDKAREGVPLCLLMADIDHFKKVNDTFGHLFGDKVIGAVASALTANVKGQDTVARLGGEEFGILLPDTDPHGGMLLAEKVRAAVERGKIRQNGKADSVGGVTISLGLTAYIPGESIDAFIGRADNALYASKGGGRNRVTLG